MRIILSIFCGLMALFGGGCALTLIMQGGAFGVLSPITMLPVAVFVLNCLVLAALWGWKNPWRPAFYTLAVADFLIAIGSTLASLSIAGQDRTGLLWGLGFAGAFAIKGVLTLKFAKENQSGSA